MSGLEALRLLQASITTRSIPVVALTAAASERERIAGLQAGFFRYLTKPLQIDGFLAALRDAFELKLDTGEGEAGRAN